jgi:putative transcriptional regulator
MLARVSERAKEAKIMTYTPIAIARKALTIMSVPFPDLETLESTAAAIGSNMFEGYEPTEKGIEIIRDYCLGKISLADLVVAAKEKRYAK